MNIQGISQILIPVKDLTRAKQFYQQILELKHLFDVPNMVFFECGGLRLLLEVLPERQSTILYFQVPDIETTYQTMLERRVAFQSKPHKIADMQTYILWMAFFYDSEENLQALMSEVPKRSAK